MHHDVAHGAGGRSLGWRCASVTPAPELVFLNDGPMPEDLLPFQRLPPSGWPWALVRGVVRDTLSPHALRRASQRRVMLAADLPQAGRVELGQVPSGTHGEQLAARSRARTHRWNATVPSGANGR